MFGRFGIVRLFLVFGSTIACQPDFVDDSWLVDSPRVLAVRSDPAEVRPGTNQLYEALVARPNEDIGLEAPSWSYCVAPKPPTDDNVVSEDCFNQEHLLDIGVGVTIQSSPPNNGCTLFGPNPAPGGYRPRDPDGTGGYYQPIRVDVDRGIPSFKLQRITCSLADASAEAARDFAAAYVPNANPDIDVVRASSTVGVVALDTVRTAESLVIEVRWTPESRESFSYFNRAAGIIETQVETLKVSFFATGGTLDRESIESPAGNVDVSVTNRWTAPIRPGSERLWFILQDSRGGVDFESTRVTVLP